MRARERIEAYFRACSEGTADDIAAHFTPEAVIYDTNLRPVRGSDAIGTMWVTVRERWGGARWLVDSFVGDLDGAAIEWTMEGTDPDRGRPFAFRGSEHYRFGEINDRRARTDRRDPAVLDVRSHQTRHRARRLPLPPIGRPLTPRHQAHPTRAATSSIGAWKAA